MIQRIQTVYLVLTILVAVLFLSGDIILLKNGISVVLTGINNSDVTAQKPGNDWFLAALLIASALLPFIAVFLYKNRKLQIKLIILAIVLVLAVTGILAYYCYKITGSSDTSIIFTYKLLLPLFMIVFLFLAYRGIRRDENIVRSYDRLR